MKHFNLSEWALEHQPLVLFFVMALFAAGLFSYLRLGQAEDPEFTFKVMVIKAFWPGASPAEMELQVTERLEKKLQETPYLDNVRSYTKSGETTIFLALLDSTPPKEVAGVWYQVRKKIGDIRYTLPEGTQGPFFNDEFGDVFGNIYAFSGDGYTYAEFSGRPIASRTRCCGSRDSSSSASPNRCKPRRSAVPRCSCSPTDPTKCARSPKRCTAALPAVCSDRKSVV